jgi:VCBS repeat-containing protein
MEVTTRFQDTEGNPIESANVGDDFQIVLSAKDLRTEGDKLGVFSAFADVNYDTVLANVTEVSPAGDFNFPVNFDPNEAINDDEGLLDEIGGSNANFTPVASDEPQDFAIITATATAQGELEITPDVGDGPTSLNTLFGLDNDVNSGTDYFGESLSIAPPELTVQEDAVTTNEDATVEGNVVSNDDGLNLTVTAINGAETIGEEIQTDQGALVTLNADGTFSYNPNGQFEALIEGESQTDSFTYTVTDQVGQTDEATVTVTIEGTGVAADAIEDSITLEEGETRELDVLANDTGTEPLTVTEVAGSAENVGEPIETDSGALVTLAADGSLTYNTNGAFEALAQGETETDSFSYTITDDDGLTDQAEVNITINGVGAADLVVTSFDVTNDHVLGAEATVNFTVENQGEAASPGFQVELLYYTSNGDDEPLSEEDPEVVKTLSLGEEDFDSTELAAGEAVTATSEQVSLPIETLLAEALEDDPSIFGENLQGVESNNIDHLGIRIKDSVNSGESEETFGNNALNDTEGVNIDDITYFPWDFVNNAEDGYNPNEEDEIITDGAVTPTDATAVFRNIGLLINEDQTEGEFGADLERIDFDLDSAISPVDAVRVVNRLGYVINPDVIEGNEEADLNGVANDGLA